MYFLSGKPRYFYSGVDNCRQSVGGRRDEDVDYLPIAVVGVGELAPHVLHRGRQNPALEGNAVAQGARRASEHRHVVPWVVDCIAASVEIRFAIQCQQAGDLFQIG